MYNLNESFIIQESDNRMHMCLPASIQSKFQEALRLYVSLSYHLPVCDIILCCEELLILLLFNCKLNNGSYSSELGVNKKNKS